MVVKVKELFGYPDRIGVRAMCGTYTHSAVIISFKYPSQERKILPAARTTLQQGG